MTDSFSIIKVGTRAFLLVVFVLLVVMLLPHAAHAQSLPYPIDPNMGNPPNPVAWTCHSGGGGMGSTYGEYELLCTAAENAGTQIVGEFTITDLYGNTAEA